MGKSFNIFDFDKDSHRAKMKPHVDKLVEWLKINHSITFESSDGSLENVVFKNETKTVKISHHCFYRFSGLCRVPKQKTGAKQNEFEFVDVNDDMFINSYMKSIILLLFKIEE